MPNPNPADTWKDSLVRIFLATMCFLMLRNVAGLRAGWEDSRFWCLSFFGYVTAYAIWKEVKSW